MTASDSLYLPLAHLLRFLFTVISRPLRQKLPLHQHQPVSLNPCVAVSVPKLGALMADMEETSRGFNQKETSL